MIDLHTHILPGMDDGSRTVAESIQLLSMERQQGVDTVYLTPHFYRDQEEPTQFLRRRQAAFDALKAALPEDMPRLCLGAEVAWFPNLHTCEELEQLRLGDSKLFLLELPFRVWNSQLFDELYQLPDRTGLTPILAHVERYAAIQGRKRMKELLNLGLPMQMNASFLLEHRFRAPSLLKRGEWMLVSDCHRTDMRPPNLGQGAELLRKKLGPEAERMLHWPL